MTEIDRTVDPFVEAGIKEHNASIISQMVAVGVIIFVMLILVGATSLIIDAARSLVGLLSRAFESSIFP
jgi:hypothetical protein